MIGDHRLADPQLQLIIDTQFKQSGFYQAFDRGLANLNAEHQSALHPEIRCVPRPDGAMDFRINIHRHASSFLPGTDDRGRMWIDISNEGALTVTQWNNEQIYHTALPANWLDAASPEAEAIAATVVETIEREAAMPGQGLLPESILYRNLRDCAARNDGAAPQRLTA